MAIYSAVPPPDEDSVDITTESQASSHFPPQSSTIDIETWSVQALESLGVSPLARGTGTPLTIPLDDYPVKSREVRHVSISVHGRTTPTPRPRSARDSQRRREMLQKGKEGSRQRRRWENDRLIGVPNAQPPLPADWEVHPTHPIHHVPYHIAQFWDKGLRQRIEEKTAALESARKDQQRKMGSATGLGVGEVPRDLRESTKRSPVIRGWVRVLEEPVRGFLLREKGKVDDDGEMDSGDEEIVFAGRSAGRDRTRWKKAYLEAGEQLSSGMVFDSLGDDESAAFKRWLTHSISDYYGLESRSVTVGDPPRRIVYVGLKLETLCNGPGMRMELPRPLWESC